MKDGGGDEQSHDTADGSQDDANGESVHEVSVPMSDVASKEDFFGCCGEHVKEPFTLPNGKVVFVEEITALDFERFQQDMAQAKLAAGDGILWTPDAKARLIVRCVTDGDSKP